MFRESGRTPDLNQFTKYDFKRAGSHVLTIKARSNNTFDNDMVYMCLRNCSNALYRHLL